jgi:hypothetical protein
LDGRTLLLRDVNTCLNKLESSFIPGGVRRILDRSLEMEMNEKKVIDLFCDAST